MNVFPRNLSPYCPAWPPAAIAASRSQRFCTRSSSWGASGVAAVAAASGAPSARPAPAPYGSATDISSSISLSQSILPITSRQARLIWSATRRRHCAICQTTKTSSTKCVPSTVTSSPSVTGSIATQLYKQQADLFSTEAWRVFSRLAASTPTPAVLESVSRRSPAGSLQSCCDPCSGRVRPSASARASVRTELYFLVRTQTLMSSWRPENANSDSMSLFFFRAFVAEQSSIIKSVGSPLNIR